MIITGIVVEYNPFHNGHIHHIKQARELTKCDLLVAVMSPTFMQRGEPALVNKYLRASYAIKYGVDLVIELPSIFAINSANHFAYGAMKLLNEVGINYLVFGSETNDVSSLQNAAKLSHTKEYQDKVNLYMKDGLRYANACNQAFEDYKVTSISQSNDILGLAYIQEIVEHDYDIIPLSIQRTNEYLSDQLEDSISSATSIRKAILNKQDVSIYTPMAKDLENSTLVDFNDYFKTFKYIVNISSINHLREIYGISEGLEYLFKKNINKASNMDDFIDLVSSKRYPKTRIQRLITYIICNLTKNEYSNYYTQLDYIRILAMNQKGQAYIKLLKKQTDYKVISNLSKHDSPLLDYEQRVTYVYTTASNELEYLNDKEYKESSLIFND